MTKLIVVIPDGVAVRNFLYSDFLEKLLASAKVDIWHALPEASLAPYRARYGERVTWRKMQAAREGALALLLRQAKVFSQLFWQSDRDGTVFVRKFFASPRGWRSRALRIAATLLGRVFASARGTRWLHAMHAFAVRRTAACRSYRDELRRSSPDLVFCTHQRAGRAIPFLAAARWLGIPTATFVYSWDNLPKGRMAVHADHFLVWSEHMATQLRHYQPETAVDSIHVVGTPQFEPYADDRLIESRQEFCASWGLDAERPIVCYSGGDTTSARHDPAYLADLAGALRGWQGEPRPQLLFRRSPADFSPRYDQTIAAFPEIVVCDPIWYRETSDDWTQIVALPEDAQLLVNVARHSSVVVNVGSTMALDFAVFDKPSIFIAYDPEPFRGHPPTIDDTYRLPHFRSVLELQPVAWARGPEELASLVARALVNPGERQEARHAWLAQQVAQPISSATERCAQALLRIAATPTATADRVRSNTPRRPG